MPIGVIGAGLMGTAITRRLLDAKHEVVAYDVDEGKRDAIRGIGARVAESVHKLASECEIVVLAVFSTDQVEQVVEGPGSILGAIPPHPADRIVICTSTCDPDRLAALASRVGAVRSTSARSADIGNQPPARGRQWGRPYRR